MAKITIDALPPAVGLDGTEFVPIAKNTGAGYLTEKTTVGAMANGGANASYIVANNAFVLPEARVLAPEVGKTTVTDNGPGSTFVVGLADSGVTAGEYGDGGNIPQITVDETGRVIEASQTPITGFVPDSREVIAGNGLQGGGDLSTDVTLSLANSGVSPGTYGDSGHVPEITVDDTGRVTTASQVPIAGFVPDTREIIAGIGLTGGGPLSSDVTLSLSSASIASLALADSALQLATGIVQTNTITSLSNIDHTATSVAYLIYPGRAGFFLWISGDFTTEVAADTQNGIYVASFADPSGSAGSWVRVTNGISNIEWFGAVAAASTAVDPVQAAANSVAIQAALDLEAGPVFIPGRSFQFDTTLLLSDGFRIVGAAPMGVPGATYDQFPQQSLLYYTGTDAAFKSKDETTFLNHGAMQNFSILGSSNWIFDIKGMLACSIISLDVNNLSATGGILRSVAVVGQPNWINFLVNCNFKTPLHASQYIMDFEWTDSVISGCEIGGGMGTRWTSSSGGNVRISTTQFESMYDIGSNDRAGFLIRKQSTGAAAVMFSSCAFDNNAVGLLIDASASPGGSELAVTLAACEFRALVGTAVNDVVFIDGPSFIDGPAFTGCTFTTNLTTPFIYNVDKWGIVGLETCHFASNWTSPLYNFTPILQFGAAATGITYATQTGKYQRLGNIVQFSLQITLSSKGTATGSAVISGLPASATMQQGVEIGNSASFTGLTGALKPYISGAAVVVAQSGAAGVTTCTDTVFTNSTTLRVSGSYLIG